MKERRATRIRIRVMNSLHLRKKRRKSGGKKKEDEDDNDNEDSGDEDGSDDWPQTTTNSPRVLFAKYQSLMLDAHKNTTTTAGSP